MVTPDFAARNVFTDCKHVRAPLNVGYDLCREEFQEVIVDAVGGFHLEGMAGRERLRIDEIARELAPDGGRAVLTRRRGRYYPLYETLLTE
ncbi:MAG TPA: hypothetical protein VH684_02430 [Xanthobacteraceae bacterium]